MDAIRNEQSCRADCAHEMFEQEVGCNPEKIAVKFGHEHLTYRQLNERSNQLAQYLGRLGVRPEVLVGVCIEPSLDVAIAALAVLKAGGASVFLPPTDPDDRIMEMIRDSSLGLLITTTKLANRWSVLPADTVCIDEISRVLAAESGSNVRSGVTPDNAAYVRFTSGSTGKPKAVINVHRSLTARLTSEPLQDVRRDDVCGLNAGQGLNLRLVVPLACGATVVILRHEETRDAAQCVYALVTHKITSIYLVPSLLRQILALRPETVQRLRGVRAVTVGGEVLTPEIADHFLQMLPGTQLLSVYGSNEAGGMVTMRVVKSGEKPNSVGCPVANTRVYILDRSMNPVPVGVTGEICVASDHMARGYLNRPDLTAQVFIPNPFGTGRLYCSGDLGRYSADGEIEFLGRADQQVKIRGFRVELQEVETVLLTESNVEAAAVTMESTGSGQRLLAYVVFKPGVSTRGVLLRRFLASRLPEPMVPAVFVVLQRMPYTATGKVDRQALPPPEAVRPDLDNPYEKPCTPVEASLAEIWASALGLDRVGINDNFFELGGDSLVAAQVTAQIWNLFALEVPLASLFEAPTVSAFAACLPVSLHETRA